MIDVFFGESRTYIKDALMQKLGWKWGDEVWWELVEPGRYRVRRLPGSAFQKMLVGSNCSKIYERDGKFCFEMVIPGVRRGRLNGARGTIGLALGEGDHGLEIDVRDLLAPHNP